MWKKKGRQVRKKFLCTLLAGIIGASIVFMTGCKNEEIDSRPQQIEQTQNPEIVEALEALEKAEQVYIDTDKFLDDGTITVKVDEEEIGKLSGNFSAVYDEILFETTAGTKLAVGAYGYDSEYKEWAIYDANDKFQYGFDESGITPVYERIAEEHFIFDQDKNIVATMKPKGSEASAHCVEIATPEGNPIATVTRSGFEMDFVVEIVDPEVLDHTTIVMVSANYMMRYIYGTMQ